LQRVGFNLPELDAMLNGGFARGTSTVLAGSLGTGKTLLALHFAIAGICAGEPAIYLSFREREHDLLRMAQPFALSSSLTAALDSANGKALTLVAMPPLQIDPDIVAERLVALLDQTGERRLVIDSIVELARAIERSNYPERLDDYLAALVQACRMRDVTMLVTTETTKSEAAILDFSSGPLSVMAENVLLLQQETYRARQHHVLSVLKMRYSAYDPTLREFIIAPPEGLRVLEPLETASESPNGMAGEHTAAGQG